VFFPEYWMKAMMYGHKGKEAAQIVENFMKNNPNYPEHLKNKHVKAIGSAEVTEYKYPHNFANHYVKQEYLTVPKKYYRPTEEGYEATISKRMSALPR
jgi:replication-associated recombination protein RarA